MKRKILLTIAILTLAVGANAQNSSIMYGSSRNPLMNSVNPAFFPSRARLYFALPGVNMNIMSPLAYSSIFQYDSSIQKTVINVNNLLDTMTNNGNIHFGTNVHAVGFGLDLGNIFLTFSSQAKVDLSFGMPMGLKSFLEDGNYGHTGDDYIELLDGQLAMARVYGEAALGIGVRITDEITVGARAKLLVGYFDVSTAGSSAKLFTADDYSSITADLNININSTSVIDKEEDPGTGKVSYSFTNFFPRNNGLNFDLGVQYSTDLFDVSASIIDLGPGIHWQDGVRRLVSANENNTVTFTGLDVTSMMNGGTLDSTYTQALIDSLVAMTETKTIEGDDYWTSTPTKVNLGGMFHITNSVSAGLHFHGEFDRGLVKVGDVFKNKNVGFYSNTSILARVNLYDWVEIVASASVVSNNGKWDWFNPGFGLTLTPLRTLQIYAFLDYISNIYIIDAKKLNISAGLNLFFGSSGAK